MIEVRISVIEAVLSVLCFMVLFFGLGYLCAMIDVARGYQKEDIEKIEDQVNKVLAERGQ